MLVGFGFKVAAVPFHCVDARRLPGRAHAGRRVHGLGGQGRRLRRAAAGLLPRVRDLPGRLEADHLRPRRAHPGRRLDHRRRADRREAHAGLLARSATPASCSSGSRRPSDRGVAAVLFYLAAYTFMVAGIVRRGDRGRSRGRRCAPASTTTAVSPGNAPGWRWCSRSSCSPRPACRSPRASSPSST